MTACPILSSSPDWHKLGRYVRDPGNPALLLSWGSGNQRLLAASGHDRRDFRKNPASGEAGRCLPSNFAAVMLGAAGSLRSSARAPAVRPLWAPAGRDTAGAKIRDGGTHGRTTGQASRSPAKARPFHLHQRCLAARWGRDCARYVPGAPRLQSVHGQLSFANFHLWPGTPFLPLRSIH